MLTSASLLSNEVNSVSPTTLNRTYTNQFGIPSGILSGGTGVSGSCNVGCSVNNTSIVPNLPTANTIQSPLTVIGSGRPVSQMSDLISGKEINSFILLLLSNLKINKTNRTVDERYK